MVKNNFLILLSEIIFLIFYVIIQSLLPTCPFKLLFNLKCPFCNGRHSVNALLKLNILSSFKYNILVLPFVIFFIIFDIVLIAEMLINKEFSLTKKIFKNVKEKYIVLFFIMITLISFIYNNL